MFQNELTDETVPDAILLEQKLVGLVKVQALVRGMLFRLKMDPELEEIR
jgi:hypothetical protein